MIDFEILPRPADSARSVRQKPPGAHLGIPFALVASLLLGIFKRHIGSMVWRRRESNPRPRQIYFSSIYMLRRFRRLRGGGAARRPRRASATSDALGRSHRCRFDRGALRREAYGFGGLTEVRVNDVIVVRVCRSGLLRSLLAGMRADLDSPVEAVSSP